MNRKIVFLAGGVIALAVVIVAGWWLLSPIFIDRTVDEAFPMTANAVIPADMEREEAETVMEFMAEMEKPVEEAMPSMMDAAVAEPTARRPETPEVITTEPTPAPTEVTAAGPTAIKEGTFRDGDSFHRGSGTATIYDLGDGSNVLRLEDFSVTNGPDLRVLLVNHPDPQSRGDVHDGGYIELAPLKGNIGNQNYPIPETADIDGAGSVVIYCRPFQVVFSVAALKQAG